MLSCRHKKISTARSGSVRNASQSTARAVFEGGAECDTEVHGEGGFGAVYHGTLRNGRTVAVKVRSLNTNQGTREFTTEVSLSVRSDLTG